MNRTGVAQASNVVNFFPQSTGILQRKCTSCSSKNSAGGECVECGNKKSKLQRKLSIGSSNDPLEHEADRVAAQVMSMSPNSSIATTAPRIQRASTNTGGSDASVPTSVNRVLAGSGTQMQPALRQDMEQRFSHGFSQVRLHSNEAASKSASDINALAYTVGQNIVFGAKQYNSQSRAGRTLLAHELTHTIQQNTDQRLQRSCGPDSIGSVGGCIGVGGQDISNLGMSSDDIYRFDVNCDNFQAGEAARLSALAASLASGDRVEVHGFASEEGDPVFNENLSCARTQAAANILAGTVPLTLFKHGATSGPRDDRRSVIISVVTPAPAETPQPECSAANRSQRTTASIQPVVVAEDDGSNPTSAPPLSALNTIWSKCCMHFNALSTRVVNASSLQTLSIRPPVGGSATAEETALFTAAGTTSGVQIIVVDRFFRDGVAGKNVAGGGKTYDAGTANPRIVVVSGVVPEVVAHEVGHATGFMGHDSNPTVMQPTGAHNSPNPTAVSRNVCNRARSGSVLAVTTTDCCQNPT